MAASSPEVPHLVAPIDVQIAGPYLEDGAPKIMLCITLACSHLALGWYRPACLN